MWYIGATPNTTESERMASGLCAVIWRMLTSMFPWLSIAALGRPAVPLVNINTAISSEATSTQPMPGPLTRSSQSGPPSIENPQPMRWRKPGRPERSRASTAGLAMGPAITAAASTASNSLAIAAVGEVGFSGTTTNPAPIAARYETTK
jgi:hypothetical protein